MPRRVSGRSPRSIGEVFCPRYRCPNSRFAVCPELGKPNACRLTLGRYTKDGKPIAFSRDRKELGVYTDYRLQGFPSEPAPVKEPNPKDPTHGETTPAQ